MVHIRRAKMNKGMIGVRTAWRKTATMVPMRAKETRDRSNVI